MHARSQKDEPTDARGEGVCVSYARGRAHPRMPRIVLIAFIVVVVIPTIIVLLPDEVSWMDAHESCVRCTADSSVTQVSIFGFTADRNRTVTPNPIAVAIQACEGSACQHVWRTVGSTERYSLLGGVTIEDRLLPLSYMVAQRFGPVPGLGDELRRQCARDPAFLRTLREALGDYKYYDRVLTMFENLEHLAATRTGPASSPATGGQP